MKQPIAAMSENRVIRDCQFENLALTGCDPYPAIKAPIAV